MKRNHRNTRPPTRATAAPTTIIVMVVVLENPDDEDVCDGRGAPVLVVVSETGVEKADTGSVVGAEV